MADRRPGHRYTKRFEDFLVALDEYGDPAVVEIEDLPRGVRDAIEEDAQDHREWDGDLSE